MDHTSSDSPSSITTTTPKAFIADFTPIHSFNVEDADKQRMAMAIDEMEGTEGIHQIHNTQRQERESSSTDHASINLESYDDEELKRIHKRRADGNGLDRNHSPEPTHHFTPMRNHHLVQSSTISLPSRSASPLHHTSTAVTPEAPSTLASFLQRYQASPQQDNLVRVDGVESVSQKVDQGNHQSMDYQPSPHHHISSFPSSSRPTSPNPHRLMTSPQRQVIDSSDPIASTSRSTSPRSIHRVSPHPQFPSRPVHGRSHSSSTTSAYASTSSAQLPHHTDPTAHWLSEDEGSSMIEAELLVRRKSLERRRRARGESEQPRDESGEGPEGSDRSSEGKRSLETFTSTTTNSHPIHHRPATTVATPPPPVPSPLPSPPLTTESTSLRSIIPAVLAVLTCKACHRLLVDPTTLGCGHSICFACNISSLSHLSRISTDLPADGVPASESQFARNSSSPRLGQAVLPLVGSILGAVLPFGSTSSSTTADRPVAANRETILGPGGIRAKVVCPVKDCLHKDRTTAGALDSKVDFVLQKVLGLLHREIPDFDLEVRRADLDHDETDVGHGSRSKESARPSLRSAASSSSSGGADDPAHDEDSKRLHRSKTWRASKRVRRYSDLCEGEVTELDEGLDMDQVPSTFLAELQSELECQVCVQLYHEPITTPCGHTFCQKCLARSLDHSDKCPLCRADFPSFTFFQSQPINSTTQRLISTAFPTLSADRQASIDAEERSNSLDTPIFVCTLAWPNLPTYIHIFEPRYRLMMRRVMDGDQQFGMILPSRTDGGLSEYGTMLRIKSCNMIEDGRSIVETVGTYRFRLLEKGTFDGYTVGRIERVDDISEEQEAELERIALSRNVPGVTRDRGPPIVAPQTATSPPPQSPSGSPPAQQAVELSTNELMSICLEFVDTLRSGSAPWVLQRLNNTIGPMPTNPSDFSYWMAEVMPVDDHVKAALLQITSSRERLRLLVFWIDQFRSAWWFRSGCTIV